MAIVLLVSVFVISTCGLVYELIAGALATYLLGDSITQFSTVIGVYLFSMGIGSWLSRYIEKNLVGVFVQVELVIGLVGGCSAALMFGAFEHVSSFRILLYGLVCVTGTLVGLEIPMLMRILKAHYEFKDLVAKVFTFDYIGALIASILFPLLLIPYLGLIRTGFLFGILNVLVGLWALVLLDRQVVWAGFLRVLAAVILVGLAFGFAYSENIMRFAETATYRDNIIYAKTTPYQRIILTHSGDAVRLYLNGNLQFNSRDEYRYHEALVHVGLAAVESPQNVLVLGGGDGLAVREILKYPSVRKITLVDLDKKITELFSQNEILMRLNSESLLSPKVRVVNQDAFVWLKTIEEKYDFIAIDFPDPTNYSLGKLYTNAFYRLVHKALSDTGVVVVQSTSPYVAKKSFWCVESTLRAAGFLTAPYHAYVPSFGDWGYIIAGKQKFNPPSRMPEGLRFVSLEAIRGMFYFPDDMKIDEGEVNRLNNQVLVRLFEDEWSGYVN